MSRYFYCPNCKAENGDFKFKSPQEEREMITIVNCRDGYGTPIYHVICPVCNNPLSGYMHLKVGDSEEVDYYRDLIYAYNHDCKNGGYLKEGTVESLKQSLLKDKDMQLKSMKAYEIIRKEIEERESK